MPERTKHKQMLINTLEGQECRIAIVEDGKLQELYIERSSSISHVGNIYKGRITNVEPAIQAAFVDFGLGKNGFLHISDVHRQYFPKGQDAPSESVGRKRPHRHRPPIQECFRRGQEVVVQMIKEGIGTKGPTLTTYLSVPGRLLVMMPAMSRLGVSRRVEDDELRAKAKTLLSELKLPENMGFILRTAGIDRSKRDLQRDLNYLTRLWKTVKQRIKTTRAPAEIYQESDLVIRTIRDVYNTDMERIICDSAAVARKVREFLSMAMPRGRHVIEVYQGRHGLFHDVGVESEIEKMQSRRVDLPSGGSLVIDQTEALVAIDVNSGRFREHSDAETTALKTDLEAAKEIARQLRVRDLGGVIVMDFIDLRDEKGCRQVEKALRDAMKPDRAKSRMLRMSQFGIVEMTRQRMRPSLEDSVYGTCRHCEGSGVVKSEESQAIQVIRELQSLCGHDDVAHVELTVTPLVAEHLNNNHRGQLSELEARSGRTVTIRAKADLREAEVRISCTNARGSSIPWERLKKASPGAGDLQTIGIDELDAQPEAGLGAAEGSGEAPQAPGKRKKSRRRGRRSGRKHKAKTANTGEVGGEGAAAGEDRPGEPPVTPEGAPELREPEATGDYEAPAEDDRAPVPGFGGSDRAGAAEELDDRWPLAQGETDGEPDEGA